jgi:hypothetical protein
MPKRNKKGQYVKSSHHGSHHTSHARRSSPSKALVRTSTVRPVVIRERVTSPTKRKGSGHRHRHHGGSGGRMPLTVKGEMSAYASILGYLKTNKTDTYNQIPTAGGVPRSAVVGLVGHFFGKKHKHIDRAAAAALIVAGFEIGAAGYKLSGDDE